jgi:hypothetical protein
VFHYSLLALRILCLLGGVFIICVRVFLYESEQGKIESKIQDLWNRIREFHPAALSRHVSFMNFIAGSVDMVLNIVFGSRLVSLEAMAVSVCYSIVSVFLTLLVLQKLFLHQVLFSFYSLLFFYLVLGSAPLFFRIAYPNRSERLVLIWLVAMITSAYWQFLAPAIEVVKLVHQSQYSFFTSFVVGALFCVTIAFGAYFMSVVVLRITIRRVSASKSLLQIALILLLNLVPIVAIYGLIKVLEFKFEHWSSLVAVNPSDITPDNPEALKQILSSWNNLFDVMLVILLMALFYFEFIFSVSALLSFLMSLFLIVHRLFWPTMLRVLDACKRNRIISEGRVLLIVGALLIIIGIGKFQWIEKIFLKVFG